MAYTANSASPAKTVSLSKGLNFVNGSNTIAIVNDDGKVSFDLNRTTKNQINTNTTGVTANKANIATNLADIATNKNKIAANTTDIATNKGKIATNTTNIAQIQQHLLGIFPLVPILGQNLASLYLPQM